MLRFTILLAVLVASAFSQSNIFFKDNITPEEAQGYLRSLPFNVPELSQKSATLPLVRYDNPSFRTADAGPTLGHYWKNGREIENTNDYLEDVYNAAQYHGQDGLGQYAYGYKTPESSKVENREHSGVVRGSYVYKSSGYPELIKVDYWSDGEGFHQQDNIPKVELQPAQETPALREGRLAFERAWKAAAEANRVHPVAPYYEPAYQGQASEARPVAVAAPVEAGVAEQAREGKAYAGNYQQPQKPQQFGQQQQFAQQQQYQQEQYSQQQQQQQYGQQKYGQQKPTNEKYEEPEPTGPPHGFFYSFDYPVSIIVPKNEQKEPGYAVDHDTVGVGHNYNI